MPRDPEKVRAQKKRYYEKYKDKILAYQKEYVKNNAEKILARNRAKRAADPDAAKAAKRAEYLRNRDKYLAYNAAAREKRRIAAGPKPKTLMEELGLVGPYLSLPKEDKLRFQREFRARNREKYRARAKAKYSPEYAAKHWAKHYQKNKDKLLEKSREWRMKNPEKVKEFSKKMRLNDPEAYRARWKGYYQKNREKLIARSMAYSAKNKDKVRASQKRRHNERYHSDPAYKMMSRMRYRFYEIMRKQNQKTSKTLRLSKDQVVAHIEKQFLPGMTWENHGKVWHVDHIIPCHAFNFGDYEQALKCFSLKNLRPLWARENIQKGKKIIPELLEKHGLAMPALDTPLGECPHRA